jgi:hypothetical protein
MIPLARLLLLSAVVLSSGCVAVSKEYTGNPISEDKIAQIEVGKTTRAEVLELFGSPLRIDRTDITALAERALTRYSGEELTLKIDPSLFDDVYIWERVEISRHGIILGLGFNYVTSDERSDRLSVFFDKNGLVLGVGWTAGRKDL